MERLLVILLVLIVVAIVVVVLVRKQRADARNGGTKSELKRQAKQRPDIDDFMK